MKAADTAGAVEYTPQSSDPGGACQPAAVEMFPLRGLAHGPDLTPAPPDLCGGTERGQSSRIPPAPVPSENRMVQASARRVTTVCRPGSTREALSMNMQPCDPEYGIAGPSEIGSSGGGADEPRVCRCTRTFTLGGGPTRCRCRTF